MKRLNPITNKPFKQGDIREDGYMFKNYIYKRVNKTTGFFIEDWIHPDKIARRKQMVKESIKNHYEANKDVYKENAKKWTAANLTKRRKIRQDWKKENRGIENTYNAKRRAAKLKRTPIWLTKDDHWLIQQAYELARLRTELLGYPWHVDHDIPLQAELASGLHVPLNLKVIPGIENCKKSNAYQP